jgi:hypothetical protein
MTKTVLTISPGNLIEYQGEFYTAEQLTEIFQDKGGIEIIQQNELEQTWFEKAMAYLDSSKKL